MYLASLEPASNKATFRQPLQVNDSTTGSLIDLTGYAITFEIKDRTTKCVLLSATLANSKVTVTGTGTFEVLFTDTEMGGLCAAEYDVRCRVTEPGGDVDQLIVGSVTVVDG